MLPLPKFLCTKNKSQILNLNSVITLGAMIFGRGGRKVTLVSKEGKAESHSNMKGKSYCHSQIICVFTRTQHSNTIKKTDKSSIGFKTEKQPEAKHGMRRDKNKNIGIDTRLPISCVKIRPAMLPNSGTNQCSSN